MHASFMSVALASLLAGQVSTSQTPTTRLYVRTVPPGAEIKLDGHSVGKSDYLFTVPEGKHKVIIELELDGYQSEQRTVEIRGGRVKRVELKLAPKAADSPTDLSAEVGRTRHFVRLVIGRDLMTFEGRDVTWEDLPAFLEKIPHRERTVLEIARGTSAFRRLRRSDDFNENVGKAISLARRFGFEYPSIVGEHPLGSKGSPAQPLPDDGPKTGSIEERFPHVLDIRLGKTDFRDGDNITVTEIRGTRPQFEIGGKYLARGTYTLRSHADARLCFYRTTRGPTPGDPPEDPRQRMAVSEGSGEFSLEKEIRHEGYLHLSFYPKAGGSGFGEVYFGQTAEDTLIDRSSASDDAAGPTKVATPSEPDDGPRTGSIEERFPHVLDIRLGKTKFRDGNNITITEIRGTHPQFEIGGRYLARGTYTLASHDHAQLCLYRTTRGPTPSDPPEDPRQRMTISKGSGEFSLEKEIRHEGYLHISLYPKTGGSGFGEVYFGQTAEDTLIDKSSALY